MNLFVILELVGDMDQDYKGVDFLLRLLCFLSHSTLKTLTDISTLAMIIRSLNYWKTCNPKFTVIFAFFLGCMRDPTFVSSMSLFIYLWSSAKLSRYNKEITRSIRPIYHQKALAFILAVILLQKITNPFQSDMSSPLLSIMQSSQVSMCYYPAG